MESWTLILLLLVPALGATIGAFLPTPRSARISALGFSLATQVIALVMAVQFDWRQDLGVGDGGDPAAKIRQSVQLSVGAGWDNPFSVTAIGFRFHLGVDSISLWLVLLTALLTPLAIAASWGSIRERQKEYYAWMLLLLASMLGVFVARDLLLFYIFFDLTLVPMFFIIGIWGGPERRYAAGKFFLYTFFGAAFTLAAVIYLGLYAAPDGRPSFDMVDVIVYAQNYITDTARFWVLLGFLAGFAVKVPLFPVHTWLPLAHTEAPTAGSVILAGILLKLGTYGLLRLAVPIGLFDAAGVAFPLAIRWIAVFCLIGVIYGALVAWVQQDIKKLVAYSSVSHLGLCVLGLIALNDHGMQGSVMYMLNHALSTGALFLVVGMIYDRYHTRDINELSGLARRMPILAFFFVLFVLSSIGLPGLNGFVSEFLTILGAFTSDHLGIVYGAFAALGIILGAVYMLHMTARVIWGPLKVPHEVQAGPTHDLAPVEPDPQTLSHGRAHGQADAGQAATPDEFPPLSVDINRREISVLVPLAVLVVVLGVLPGPVLRTIHEPIQLIRQPLAVVQQPVAEVAEHEEALVQAD